MESIPQIIEAAGGIEKIAAAVDMTLSAIRKWPQIGIPDRHWSVLIEMGGGEFDERELYRANQAAPQRAAA